MVKLFFYFLVIVLAVPTFGAVSATVDRTTLDETQIISLTIRSEGDQQVANPDWSVLEQDFETSSPSSSTSISFVNGRMSSSATWTIQLRPKRTGTLTIPSFQFGNDRTDPIQIRVRELDPDLKRQFDEDVFFRTEIDTRRQYVQAAIHVERRLYYSSNVQLARDIPDPVDIDGALVVKIGNVESSVAIRDGKNFGVLIQRFVVFAEHSGELVIPGVRVNASVLTIDRYIRLPVTAQDEKVQILPIPDEFPADQQWFPARNVRVAVDLSPDQLDDLTVGDSINRTLTITALDSHSTGIPHTKFEAPSAIRHYPDPPQLSDAATVTQIIATRKQIETLVATEPGAFSVPATPIVWWNTETQRIEETLVPGFSVGVKPNDLSSTASEQTSAPNPTAPETDPPTGSVSTQTPLESSSLTSISTWIWNVFTALGWVVAVVFAVLLLVRKPKGTKTARQFSGEATLKNRIKNGDPREIKAAMVEWVAQSLEISNLNAHAILQDHEEVRALVRNLNGALYSKNPIDIEIKPEEIIRILQTIVKYQKDNEDTYSNYLSTYDALRTSS